MSIRTRLRNALNTRAITGRTALLSNPDSWLVDLLWGGKKNGVSVNQQSVLALSALYACLRIRSETFATFPFQVWRVKADGTEELATDHYLYDLVYREPNERQSSYYYRQTKMVHLDAYGNAYARIERDSRARPINLNILSPDDVEPYIHKGRVWYKVGEEETPTNSNEMLHLANFSYDGCKGIDPISAQKTNLSLSLAAQKYGDEYMSNGAHAKGVLSTDQSPNPNKREEATQKVIEEWENLYGGLDNTGRVPVLWGGMKYQEIGATPAAAMLLELRSVTVSEIARLYRIPEEMLSGDKKTTATRHEELMLQLSQGMLPTVKNWESEYTRKLVPNSEKGKIKIRANMDGLLRADTEAQAKILEMMFKTQSISPNEIRAFRGMSPRADGGGDEYGLPLASNIKTIEGEKN